MLRTFSLGAVLVQGRGRANRGNLILSKCQTSKIKCRWETVCRCALYVACHFFSLSLFLSPNLLSATSLFAAPCLFYASTNFRFYKLFANRYVFFFFHKLTFVRNKLNLFKSKYVNCMCVRVYNIRNDY